MEVEKYEKKTKVIEFSATENSALEHHRSVRQSAPFEQSNDSSIEVILSALPKIMRNELKRLLEPGSEVCVEELRLSIGRHLRLITSLGEISLPQFGRLTQSDAERMLACFCSNSIYSKENELNQGFVTLHGGARVGICGAPVMDDGKIVKFSNACSFNIRIARERKKSAEKCIAPLIKNGRPCSCIIASPPRVGKTTFLRDCARCFSDGIAGVGAFKVGLADERCELSGSYNGIPCLDVGERTDVLAGVPKALGIKMLIRNMSPDVIITDELAGKEEAKCISEAAKCGVAVIASVHCGSLEDVIRKAELSELLTNESILVCFLERYNNEFSLTISDEHRGTAQNKRTVRMVDCI